MKKNLILFLILAALFGFAQKPGLETGNVRETFGEPASAPFDVEAFLGDQRELFDWLVSERPAGSENASLTVRPSKEDLARLEEGDCDNCGPGTSPRKILAGITLGANAAVDFRGFSSESLAREGVMDYAGGMARGEKDGGFVWTMGVESVGATAVRILFSNFNLPEDAEVYVYNHQGQAFGPYTDQGTSANGFFWSHTLYGSEMFVQVRYFGTPNWLALRNMRFEIKQIAHIGPKFLLPGLVDSNHNEAFCSFNAPCVEDASCHTGVSQVAVARDAVAHIQFVSGPFVFICSGGLLADTDPGTQIPFFLTANHCISTASEASSMEAFFQFATASCGASCFGPGGSPSTLGANILSTGATSDYTLMQLNQSAPAGSGFLGWNATPIANTNNAVLHRISHPQGAPQAYSEHSVDTTAPTCGSWPRGGWIYSRDEVGATEGGSSGSPVLNDSGQVVGQLTGACGFNVNNPCDSVNNATVDGAFANYFSNVEQWLDPGPGGENTMHVANIVVGVRNRGGGQIGLARVTVHDENGNPVANATVTGTFSRDDASYTTSSVTNGSGRAVLRTPRVESLPAFMFCVDNITHASLTYNPDDNVETCENHP